MSDEIQAALRVGEWLHEYDHMLGLDPEVIHTANYSPLLASDLRLLIAPHITALPADEFDALLGLIDEGDQSDAAQPPSSEARIKASEAAAFGRGDEA